MLGLVFGLFCAEVIVRFTRHENAVGFYTTDPNTRLVVMKPNITGLQVKSCYENEVKTNSLGWRDDEFFVEKPKDVYRIAVLGDSFVAAFEVPLEKTFHYILEKKLNETSFGRSVEVLPIAKGGNGLYYNFRYLRDYAYKYKPDLILLMSFKNDPTEDFSAKYNGTQGLFELDEDGNLKDRSVRRSKFYDFVFEQARKSALLRLVYEFKSSGEKKLEQAWGWKQSEESLLVEQSILREISRYAQKINSKFAILTVPDEEQVNSDNRFDYVINLEKFSIINNINFLDLTSKFRERHSSSKENFYFSCDPHWNETGHLWAAEEILDFIKIKYPEVLGKK